MNSFEKPTPQKPERDDDKKEKISPFFKHALLKELRELEKRTPGSDDKKIYQDLIFIVQDDKRFSNFLKEADFSIEDLEKEYEKRFENGDKMPLSENLSNIIQYLRHILTSEEVEEEPKKEKGVKS